MQSMTEKKREFETACASGSDVAAVVSAAKRAALGRAIHNDAELAGFDGELGLTEAATENNSPEKEKNNENTETTDTVRGSGDFADAERGNLA